MTVQTELVLTPAECAAIRLLAKDLEEKGRMLEAGRGHEVDLMLHVKGTIKKGDDGTSTRKNKPTPEVVAAWFLSKLAPDAQAKCAELWQLNLSGDKGLVETTDESAKALAATMVAQASIGKSFFRSGSTTGTIALSAVDVSKLKPSVVKAIEDGTRLIEFDLEDFEKGAAEQLAMVD